MNPPVLSPDSIALLPRYEAARAALAACASVDEAKKIHDKAKALAAYARQRNDEALLVHVQEIRLRASIRIGEIVRNLESHGVGRPDANKLSSAGQLSKSAAIASAGLTQGTAYRHADLAELVGAEGENNDAAGAAAAEIYFARCRESSEPSTEKGLRAAVEAAVQAAMGPQAIRAAAKDLRRGDQAAKAAKRAEREERLGERTRAAAAELGSQLYTAIYADPAWRYETWSEATGMDRSPENHYSTMSVDEILALDVPAAAISGLFLWVPDSLLDVGIDVLRGWGFSYKCSWIWNKPRIGLGYWNRKKHEQLLFGTRGALPAPAPGTQWPSVIDAALGRHSEKPLDFARMIEGYFPTAPKVELFARAPRAGWDVWGNESDGGAP